MKQEEIVDILLTTYNSNVKFLKEQIDSILNQSYKNIRLYISDDCSTEKEVIEVLKEYQKRDSRICLCIQEKNLGFSRNFEFLLTCSTADYIMFSDHDDIWHLDKVQKSLEKIKKDKVDLVYCDERQVKENGEVIHESYLKYKNFPIVEGKENILAFTRSVSLGCSQIITKELKEKLLPFKSEVIAHDWITMFIASLNNGISFIEEPLLDYRLHENNIFGGRNFKTNIKREKQGKKYKDFLEYRKNTIEKAYLNGAKMCLSYTEEEKYKKIIKYYDKIINSKYINLGVKKYFKYLGYKKMGKRGVKEILLFHFPILSYLVYVIA